uniref:Reverse transcriptase domain-containing protein n=1 Tax=Tanacetum cinerariifolium TaxID=118510 RepID=A0A699HHJ3_TANCI|nr:hypothetical protein [Tanacetum cinerariifolium]
MTTDQFFGLEKDNPHDHIRWGSPPVARKRTPRSIHTWEDLAWDRYKDLLRAYPHHGFTELHQLDTFYSALNPADQDSLNAAGGNLLERSTQDVLTIIENKSKCLAAGGNTFQEFRDNIQGYVAAAAVNYNQGNPGYRPSGSGSLPSNTVANPKGELKAITTRSGLVIDGPTVSTLSQSINSQEDEHQEKDEVQIHKFWQMFKQLHINITLADALILMPKDPGKFLIPCGFSELKCKALADLGASINLMPLSVWKKLGLPELIPTRMTLELANRAICTPAGIARDVFIPVGKFTFPVDFVIVDYESDPRAPLSWEDFSYGLLKESINLINVFNNSSEEFLEDLFPYQPSGNPTFSLHPELTSSKVNNDIFDSDGCNVLSEKLLDLDFTKDLHPHLHDNPLSGSTTHPLLEELAHELPLEYDDNH